MVNAQSDPTLIGAATASQILNRSVKSIHRYSEQGLLTPVGRLGTRTNSAVIFHRADVESLAEKLNAHNNTHSTPQE